MEIKRDLYLSRLKARELNGSIKVITGLRRSGKSYLLFRLFTRYLLEKGINDSHIIRLSLDEDENEELLNTKSLTAYIKGLIKDDSIYYILLDEIQFVPNFEKSLNSLHHLPNVDIYVTGSNSKFLSTDILTEFRGRGDEVRIYPLSFAEFYSVYEGTRDEAWNEYYTYGGLPQIVTRPSDEMKAKYLTNLFNKVYLDDIVERNNLRGSVELDALVDILASAVGSLTNPAKLERTFKSVNKNSTITDKTIKDYVGHLMNAFLIDKAEQYDIKGKRYISTPSKFYFTDIGLRNARLNFREQEENHIMENILFNELKLRGYNVDVGVVEVRQSTGDRKTNRYEVDFVCNRGNSRYYLQSALHIDNEIKLQQEQRSLTLIDDSFKKMIIVRDNIKPWINEDGIHIVGILDFLLNQDILERA